MADSDAVLEDLECRTKAAALLAAVPAARRMTAARASSTPNTAAGVGSASEQPARERSQLHRRSEPEAQ